MTDKKELNIEELEKVTGGVESGDSLTEQMYKDFANEIGKYETANYIGQNMYFAQYANEGKWNELQSKKKWAYGTILDSFEFSQGCGITQRSCKVRIIQTNTPSEISGDHQFGMDYWHCFKDKLI